jgi:hypothetical protein
VGRSQAFVEKKSITYFIDIVGTDDDHWTNITPHPRYKWYSMMVAAALQLNCCDGNVSIFCDRGRSRSPAFLAGYLVMSCGFSAMHSYEYLSSRYLTRRKCESVGIDRDNRFFLFVKWMQLNVVTSINPPYLTTAEITKLEMRQFHK